MPIIFAQAIMFIPISLASFASSESLSGFAAAFTDHTSFWYNFSQFVLVVLFTYFYTAITVNPFNGRRHEEKRRIYSRG
jgi:preprotein translocase subunit SecY